MKKLGCCFESTHLVTMQDCLRRNGNSAETCLGGLQYDVRGIS